MWQPHKPILDFYLPLFLEQKTLPLTPARETIKSHGYITHACQVNILLFCVPSLYCSFMEQYLRNSTIENDCVFLPGNAICMYIVHIKG